MYLFIFFINKEVINSGKLFFMIKWDKVCIWPSATFRPFHHLFSEQFKQIKSVPVHFTRLFIQKRRNEKKNVAKKPTFICKTG